MDCRSRVFSFLVGPDQNSKIHIFYFEQKQRFQRYLKMYEGLNNRMCPAGGPLTVERLPTAVNHIWSPADIISHLLADSLLTVMG